MKSTFEQFKSLLCYIMRTGSGHYQSFGAHFSCSLWLFSCVKFWVTQARLQPILIHLPWWRILNLAFLLAFSVFIRIVTLSFLTPWGTYPRKAYSWTRVFLFQWNVLEKGPKNWGFLRPRIYRSIFLNDLHSELVKMKHLHFRKVSLQFFRQIPSLQTCFGSDWSILF